MGTSVLVMHQKEFETFLDFIFEVPIHSILITCVFRYKFLKLTFAASKNCLHERY